MPMEKTSEKKEEKKGQSDRYWYDPDCGPVYPD
ncbi:MAG: hypothetical protein A4E67_01523 [Syntrophaceae bacterium PtaB.Bin038]|nr:MAG: hypothetical protein A4E67_01523 [Syntrophaceae bacterium PtaB.Bin038]